MVPRAGVRRASHLLSEFTESEVLLGFDASFVFARLAPFASAALRCALVVTGWWAARVNLPENSFRAIEQKLICLLPA